jgi:hypothetical protein
MFSGVSLLFRSPTPGRLYRSGRFRLIVPCEVSRLVVIIIVTLNFFFKSPWGFSGLTVLFSCRFRYLIYLVRMAFGFLWCWDVPLFWRDALSFLRSSPEIIVQARGLVY